MVFSMSGCAPCAQYEPVVKQLQDEGWPIQLHKDAFELADTYGVSAYPTTIVVDAQGKVIWSHAGYIDLETAHRYLDKYHPYVK
jgi:thioredoxin-related protein